MLTGRATWTTCASVSELFSILSVTRWSTEALGGTTGIPQAAVQGRLIIERPILDKNGKPLPAAGVGRENLAYPIYLTLAYAQTGDDLWLRWIILAGFCLLSIPINAFLLGRSTPYETDCVGERI